MTPDEQAVMALKGMVGTMPKEQQKIVKRTMEYLLGQMKSHGQAPLIGAAIVVNEYAARAAAQAAKEGKANGVGAPDAPEIKPEDKAVIEEAFRTGTMPSTLPKPPKE